jgi:iron complex outermembrane receptor protein
MARIGWRTGWGSAVLLGLLTHPVCAFAQPRVFDIPRQNAASAIAIFGLQAGVRITAPVSQLRGVQTPALRGTLDARAALDLLLGGTGLVVARDDGRTITLQMSAKPDATPPIDPADLSELVVTGTRVQGQKSSAVVETRTQRDLSKTGKTSVQQMTAEIGALVGSSGDDDRTTGESALNLRNLGQNRTLTLIDGRRFVGGFNGSSAVDLNTVPAAMIDRVEVLTGGASAVYGADAVTGVVNIIMKKDFDGLAFDAQYGDAERGDFRDQVYSLTAGRNFRDGRGNLTLNYTFGERPDVLASSRSRALDIYEHVSNPAAPVPRYVLMDGTREAMFTYGGALIDPGRLFSAGGFKGDGTPFVHGTNVGGFAGTTEVGGDGTPSWTLFNDDVRPGNVRHILTLKGHYEVSPAFRPYVDLHLSDVRNDSLSQETQLVNQPIGSDTAFIPANVRAAAGSTGIVFSRWDYDGGLRDVQLTKRTFRVVAGADGELARGLHYDVSANYGEVHSRAYTANTRIYDRYLAAMDAVVDPATGRTVCRSDIDPRSFNRLRTDALAVAFNPALGPVSFTAGPGSGCVPFNPFTTDRASQAQALSWIYQPTVDYIRNRLAVLSGYVTADTGAFFRLPGGPVSLVAGAERRREESKADFDPLTGSPRKITNINNTDLNGRYDVSEVFGEVSLPVLRDFGPLVRELTIDGAYRYSNYSTVGSTSTWKVGGALATVGGLRARMAISKAVRAPTIGELFTPVSNTVQTIGTNDPCATANVGLGTPNRRANCETALRALGVNPATFNPLLGTRFPATSGGNPGLEEETARTTTYGAVWQPPFVPGLSLSADHYDIELNNAVITPTVTSVFNACYDAPSLNNIFCGLLQRQPGTGLASFVQINAVNVAKIHTSGYEFGGSYGLATDLGRFTINGQASYLQKLELQKTPLPVLTDDRGLFDTDTGGSSPKWVVNVDLAWARGDWDLDYRLNYSSGTLRNGLLNVQRPMASSVIDDPFIKAYVNHDIQVGYRLHQDSRLYVGVHNLADKYPDKVQGSLNAIAGRWGYAGRTYYVGVNLKFADVWN